MRVTREDVARLAGVSAATVSYVINNGPRPVAEKTRKKVLAAIEQLDYHPSAIAQSLKTQRTHSVGIIVSDILNPILAAIAKGAEDLLLAQGYSLTACNSDESPERELMWLRMLVKRRMDGLVLLPSGGNYPFLFSLVRSGQTMVLIDRQIEGLNADCVLFDNKRGAYEAVSHLIALGHSRIGFLNLPSFLTPGHERRRGYELALQDAGLHPVPELIKEGSFKAQESSILARQLLDISPPPTAIFVASNRLAQGVLWQVKARRLRMPDDLALCVFDDVDFYEYTTPSITAVSYDTRAMSKAIVQFLVERMSGFYTGIPRVERIPCRLQVRESTAGEGYSSCASEPFGEQRVQGVVHP